MQLYIHDDQGLYLGTVEARLSPARPQNPDGSANYLYPANSTDVPPPGIAEGQAAVFDGQAWRVVEDHRGKIAFATDTRRPVAIQALGPVPGGYTLIPSAGPVSTPGTARPGSRTWLRSVCMPRP